MFSTTFPLALALKNPPAFCFSKASSAQACPEDCASRAAIQMTCVSPMLTRLLQFQLGPPFSLRCLGILLRLRTLPYRRDPFFIMHSLCDRNSCSRLQPTGRSWAVSFHLCRREEHSGAFTYFCKDKGTSSPQNTENQTDNKKN